MKFKHLKLFGACSVATLLFCFNADGMNLFNVIRPDQREAIEKAAMKEVSTSKSRNSESRNMNSQNGGKPEGTRSFNPQKPNNNVQNKSNSERTRSSENSKKENTKRSTIEKGQEPSKGIEQPFTEFVGGTYAEIIGNWYVDTEEREFFSGGWVSQLIDHGGGIKKDGRKYGNQCAILALNLSEDEMAEVYDSMDKLDDFKDEGFASYLATSGGLSNLEDVNQAQYWDIISDIIKHRIVIYARLQNNPYVGYYSYGKEGLPVKRVYGNLTRGGGHYQELRINKKPNAETSEQRNREERSRDAETPKQEKQKTVEDVRKEFINAINAKKKPGEKKINILKNIFENSGLTDNKELKEDIDLLENFFGGCLDSFNQGRQHISNLLTNFKSECRTFYNDEDLKNLKTSKEMGDQRKKFSEIVNKLKDLENGLKWLKDNCINIWKGRIQKSKSFSEVLKNRLKKRASVLGDQAKEITECQEMLRSIYDRMPLKHDINYSKPTFEQAKKFTIAECEEAVKQQILRAEYIDSASKNDWSIYLNIKSKILKNDGKTKYADKQDIMVAALRALMAENSSLFRDPGFVRKLRTDFSKLKKLVLDGLENNKNRLSEEDYKQKKDSVLAVFEVISKL